MDLMELRRRLMMRMVAPAGWTAKTITATVCTNAAQIKTLIESVIGSSKRAMVYADLDYSTMPAVNQTFLSAVLYNGFAESLWTRYNTSGSGAIQSNESHGSTSYWTTAYGLVIDAGTELFVIYENNG